MIPMWKEPQRIEVDHDKQVLQLGNISVKYRESRFKPLAAIFALMAVFELMRKKVGIIFALFVILPAIPIIATLAYVAPSTRATGFLVTAAVWNQDVVDNMIAVRALSANAPFTYPGSPEFHTTIAVQNFITHSLPVMGDNDSVMVMFSMEEWNGGAGTSDLAIKLGATTVFNLDVTGGTQRPQYFMLLISNDDSATAQTALFVNIERNAGYSQTVMATASPGVAMNQTAVDTSSPVDLVIEFSFTGASASNVGKFLGGWVFENIQ